VAGISRSSASRLLRYLLLTAAWNAPLPFLHSHGTRAAAPGESQCRLADHVRACHATIDPTEDIEFGWHVHFLLPEYDADSPDTPHSPRQQILGGGGFASWDTVIRLHPLLARWPCPLAAAVCPGMLSAHSPSTSRCSRRFFSDCAPGVPLPLRLGVMRC